MLWFCTMRAPWAFGQCDFHSAPTDCRATGSKLGPGRGTSRSRGLGPSPPCCSAGREPAGPKAEKCMSFLGNGLPPGRNAWGLIYQNNVPIKCLSPRGNHKDAFSTREGSLISLEPECSSFHSWGTALLWNRISVGCKINQLSQL